MAGKPVDLKAIEHSVSRHDDHGCCCATSMEEIRSLLAVLRETRGLVRAWADAGDAKMAHVLTCEDCERLEQDEARWCDEASRLGREILRAGESLRLALALAVDGR